MIAVSRTGFYGKIPSRGDFVRAGLPRQFTDPWDFWLQVTIAAGADWPDALTWRFALAPGACGPHGVLGVVTQSFDRVGRQFPLTIARVAATEIGCDHAFLDLAEHAAHATIAELLAPQHLADRLAMPCGPELDDLRLATNESAWWREGMAAHRFIASGLPATGAFEPRGW